MGLDNTAMKRTFDKKITITPEQKRAAALKVASSVPKDEVRDILAMLGLVGDQHLSTYGAPTYQPVG